MKITKAVIPAAGQPWGNMEGVCQYAGAVKVFWDYYNDVRK